MPVWVWQILLGATVTGFGGFLVWVAKSINELRVEVESSKRQLALVPLAALIQSQLLSDIHHDEPGFEETDKLIDEFKNLTITKERLAKLKVLIGHRMTDPRVTELERRKSEALLAIMKVVVIQEQGVKEKIADTILSFLVGLSVATLHGLRYYRPL